MTAVQDLVPAILGRRKSDWVGLVVRLVGVGVATGVPFLGVVPQFLLAISCIGGLFPLPGLNVGIEFLQTGQIPV